MRVWLGYLGVALALPCHAQNGTPVTREIGGREIVQRDWVGLGQYTIGADGTIEVPDYAFSALLPKYCRVQIGDSGGHVHGFVVTLGREGCEGPPSNRYMSIWPDFNVLDKPDALSDLSTYESTCAPGKAEWAHKEWSGAVDGLQTAWCRRELPGGKIEIALQAMGGKWPEEANGLPRLSYKATLSTTQAALERDMAIFREFVCSIDVVSDGTGSTLCAAKVS